MENNNTLSPTEAMAKVKQMHQILSDTGLNVEDVKAVFGGTITLFKVYFTSGTRMAQVRSREGKIAQGFGCHSIRIIAFEDSVGIEVPNSRREPVSLRDVMSCPLKTAGLPLFLGLDVARKPKVIELASAPHILIAGATKQGKTVCLNDIIYSLLLSEKDVQFIMADPKGNELSSYDNLPERYFFNGCGVLHSQDSTCKALESLAREMERREKAPKKDCDWPKIVVVIDEYSDYLLYGDRQLGRSFLCYLLQIASKGRAVGIHCIITTNRLTSDVISGLIKAGFPTRMAMRTATRKDSELILDYNGAEHLLGAGDALLLSEGMNLSRIQCAEIPREEIEKFVESLK